MRTSYQNSRVHFIYSRSLSLLAEEEEIDDNETLDVMERGMLLDAVDILNINGNAYI